MHRVPDASALVVSDIAASEILGRAPKRGAIWRNKAASSGPHPKTVIPIFGTIATTSAGAPCSSEETERYEDAGDPVRRVAFRAGAVWFTPLVKPT